MSTKQVKSADDPSQPTKLKASPSKLGAEKLTPEDQRRRFIEAAKASGASEDEAEFDALVRRFAKPKPAPAS